MVTNDSSNSDDGTAKAVSSDGRDNSDGFGDPTASSGGAGETVREKSDVVGGDSGGNSDDIATGEPATPAPTARDLLSARPFVRAAKLWRDKGWIGTIPLPAKSKNPPPVGWTGRNAGFASNEQVSEWARLAQYKRGNIGLHLGFPVIVNGKEYQVVGIDVDNYEDNGKNKEGGRQLKALESTLGTLPPTYVSTARASRGDYVSGIRFYLVPSGLAFRGQADRDIEVIQKNHRFAVVWPSYNPKSDSQYCLYSPDAWANQGDPTHEIPDVTTLPILPDKWVDHLTNGKMRDDDGGIDMDSTVDEVEEWAKEQFNDGSDICVYTRKVLNKWKKKITDEATSHDKVRDAHWELINCAAEGHTGWSDALVEIDRHWIEDVMARSKRGAREMRMEMFRSRINALRKVKVRVENASSAGGIYTPAECVCAQRAKITAQSGPGGNAGGLFITDSDLDNDSLPPDGLENVSWGNGDSPDEYEMNDDGNGEFLCDLLRYKNERVKWAEGYGWILWTDSTPDRPARWLHDQDGLIRRAFWRVKRHQEAFAEQKYLEADQLWAQTNGRTFPKPDPVKAAFALAKQYRDWALKSGNNRQAENAIHAAKQYPGVTMDINMLNKKPYLLGVANGVVELRTDGAVLRDAEPEDFVTYNTNVPWHGDYKGIPFHDRGKKMWEEYLERFIPKDRRADFQAILGHCLIGGNPERLILIFAGGTSTGKSTMLRAIGAALGDYAATVNLTIFGDHKLNPALANAMPKRVVFTSELSATDKLSAATVKRMTGNDVVRAELKGSNVEVQGVPQFVPIMATNTAPEIPGADEALRKRLLVLPFDQRIDDRKDEKRAASELEEHAAEAILSWLVEGYNMYCQLGIPRNIEIERVTDQFASDLDHVSQFTGEHVATASQDDLIPVSIMFTTYDKWCKDTNVDRREVLSRNKFSSRLTGLGYTQELKRYNGKPVRCWVAVKLTNVDRRGRQIDSVPELKVTTESEAKKKGK